MAFPVILIDSATGSDSAASGAGPGTALVGTVGRTRNTASQLRVGFFEVTPPDLSGVATDGSHALYIAISTAGQRNFSSISAKKDTQQTDTGAITAAAAILVIGSTTGYSVGDVLKVAGAGAAGADLYSTILTVDSSIQVTLNDNAGTTVAAGAVTNPKQVTLTTSQGLNTGATNTTWAIGGKRASIGATSSRKLLDNNTAAGDALTGWIVEMQSGHSETLSATLDLRGAPTGTSGPITFRGVANASTLPLLTFSNNGAAVVARWNDLVDGIFYGVIQDFELRNTNATKTASVGVSIGSGGKALMKGVKISHSTNYFWKGYVNNAGVSFVDGNTVGYCANNGIEISSTGIKATNNYVHHCGGIGFNLSQLFGSITNNIAYSNTGDGFNFDAGGTGPIEVNVQGNIADSNGGDGLEMLSNDSRLLAGLIVQNNIFSNNGGYAFKWHTSTTVVRLSALTAIFRNNVNYSNSSGLSNLSGFDAGTVTTNPAYLDAANNNFTPTATALADKGYPLGGVLPVGTYSASYSYVYPGAVQPQAVEGGGVSGIIGDGASW